MKEYGKKNAKSTIDHIRSIQAIVKYTIPFLQPKLKKLLYCQKVWWRIMQMSYSFDP